MALFYASIFFDNRKLMKTRSLLFIPTLKNIGTQAQGKLNMYHLLTSSLLICNICMAITTICVHSCAHDDVIKRKHFLRYWPFVWGIRRSPVNSPHKGQWRGALIFSLNWAWTNEWMGKQSRRWWFETPSRSLWRHCNASGTIWSHV